MSTTSSQVDRAAAIGRVAVVGAGTMGHGIAEVVALAGCGVSLFDADPAKLDWALQTIQRHLHRAVERGQLSPDAAGLAQANLHEARSLADAVEDADLVLEAVPEDLDLKRRLFAEIDALAPPHALLASNTSSLRIARIAQATRRPERVLGMHFFNPVPRMRLVEVVRHDGADAEAVDVAVAFARRLGKEPIVVRDSPGFATSRLGVVLGLEAIRMVEQGVASVEDIDRAMELGYNHPMGPLKLGDLVGLDVRLRIAEYLYQELGGEQYRPPELLRRMVAEGKLGKKTGQGFYRWDESA